MTKFIALSDDTSSTSVGEDLTLENTAEALKIYGTLAITRDLEGLALARTLKAAVDEAVMTLEKTHNLPAKFIPTGTIDKVANPFG